MLEHGVPVGVGAAAGERPSKSVMRHMTLGHYLYRQSVVPRSHPIEGVFHGRFISGTPSVPPDDPGREFRR